MSSPMPFTGTRNRFIIVFIDGGGGRYHSVIPRNNNGRHCRLSRKREDLWIVADDAEGGTNGHIATMRESSCLHSPPVVFIVWAAGYGRR